MTDVENEVFDRIAKIVKDKYPKTFVTGVYEKTPPQFPCVSLVEVNNATYTRTLDSSGEENHSELMYELNVYSNKKNSRKAECRGITALIDAELVKIGFVRRFLNPLPNMADSTIYRMTGRYSAVVSTDGEFYRR